MCLAYQQDIVREYKSALDALTERSKIGGAQKVDVLNLKEKWLSARQAQAEISLRD